jgi:hypothetical protein
MIKFEHNMLVLNNAFSKEDVRHIDDFADYVRNEERQRIIRILEIELEQNTVEDLVELINDRNIL